MATRGDRSRIEVESLSQTRGQDEIEKGKVDEGIVEIFQREFRYSILNVKLYLAVRYKFGCL